MVKPKKIRPDNGQIVRRPWRAVTNTYMRVITSLGGEEQLSEMERMIAEVLSMSYVMAREEWVPASGRDRDSQVNWSRACQITLKSLGMLGLSRKPKVLDPKVFELKDWQRGQQQDANPTNTEAL